jgi:polar amino acid transport system substrate-binding protein
MKKLSKLIILLFMLFNFSGNVVAEDVIRIASGEWSPFISKDLKHGGVVLHIISESFAAVGIKVEYGFFPWARAMALAKEGTWDGTAVWGPSTEREEHFFSVL